MPALFCVFGQRGEQQWPVCWRMDKDEALLVVELCNKQRDDLISKLTPVYTEYQNAILHIERRMPTRLSRTAQRRWIAGGGSRRENGAIEELRRERLNVTRRMESAEARIFKEWHETSFDPLFPLLNIWSYADEDRLIVYSLKEIYEDPKEIGPAKIIEARGRLWREDDDEYNAAKLELEGDY